MKKILSLLIVVSSLFSGSLKAQNDVDMLDKVLQSVVTVGVYKSSKDKMVLGFRDKKSKADQAYDRLLDMTGVVSSGSGFVVEKNGKKYVITNAHVVENASDVAGSLYVFSINRTKYEMKVVGGDSYYDFAVLEFLTPPGSEILTVKFTAKEPRIGEKVYALGNPLGEYPYTVSDGIISAKNRVRGGITGKFGFLQHSATVIWGNSGGPLVNQKGEVVGINSQIAFAKQGEQQIWQPQINFALEGDLSNRLLDDIITNAGLVKRAYLGLEVSKTYRYDEFYAIYGQPWVPEDSLPIIKNVIPGSPAASSFSDKKGAVILEVNGVPTRNVNEVFGEFEKVRPGDVVKFKLGTANGIVNAELKSTEITQRSLEMLAIYVLESTGDYKLTKQEEKVLMKTKDKENKFANKDMEKNELGIYTTNALPAGTTYEVISAGVKYDNYINKYRIKKLSDIGAAMRLSGELGEIHLFLVAENDDWSQPIQLKYSISGDKNYYQHTLWY